MRPGTIAIRLQDGLGNQMFQYALGRRLTSDKMQLVLDASWYRSDTCPDQPRPLALRDFAIKAQIRSRGEFRHYWIRPTLAGRIWWSVEQRLFPPDRRRFVAQKPTEFVRNKRMFDPRILKVKTGTYLAGWWISHLYFTGIEDVLRREFVLQAPVTPRAKHLINQISSSNSVAIHVRRGDYEKHAEIGTLNVDYYARAISEIRSRVPNAKFFLFSDDLPAARTMLAHSLAKFEAVELEPNASPAVDLTVMAACQHFINANSTFSWWGSWLGKSPHKVTIVPDCWYCGAKVTISDVYPREWIQIPV